jgi:hypothetical protein
VFHDIGTGNGVPRGVAYCDDRHADPCDCAGFVVAPPAAVSPDRADAIQEALRSLVSVVDQIGGYMTPEQQGVLWRARELSKR